MLVTAVMFGFELMASKLGSKIDSVQATFPLPSVMANTSSFLLYVNDDVQPMRRDRATTTRQCGCLNWLEY
jgi:hypothetical protein